MSNVHNYIIRHKRALIITFASLAAAASVTWACFSLKSSFVVGNDILYNKILLGKIGNTEVVVFLSALSQESISGYSYIINGNDNDTIAFLLKCDDKKLVFEQNGETKTFKITELSVDDKEISGRLKSGMFSGKRFSFKPYTTPEFKEFDSPRYQTPLFDVDTITDVKYGRANGYWTEMDYDYDFSDILKGLGKTIGQRKLNLLMDVYIPKADTLKKHPLVMLIHGGAFYVGRKDDLSIQTWCSHYASLGYVAVSLDYRMGFRPSKRSIERAGYAAIQDAHAAMRYLVENQSVFGIDTSMMFVGGTSAGAITALHLAFMTNATRPATSYETDDMGNIENSGNIIDNTFTIKGVADMWGAVYDIKMIDSKKIPVVAFHGDQDDVVPYGYDYPFTDINLGPLRQQLFGKMYGSSIIIKRLLKNGVNKSKMYTLENRYHSPHVDNGRKINDVFYYIQDGMDEFFRDITTSVDIVSDSNYYYIYDKNATNITWRVDGGIILENSRNTINVAWFGNAPEHKVYASGIIRGAGFISEFDLNKK